MQLLQFTIDIDTKLDPALVYQEVEDAVTGLAEALTREGHHEVNLKLTDANSEVLTDYSYTPS